MTQQILCTGLQVRGGDSDAVYVQVIDVCASCAEHEVGILQPQLWTLSKGQGTRTGANNVAISYRQVPRALGPPFQLLTTNYVVHWRPKGAMHKNLECKLFDHADACCWPIRHSGHADTAQSL